MAFSSWHHHATGVGRLAFALGMGVSAMIGSPAYAAPPGPEEPLGGHIIISRDVGPRNALSPEIGLSHSVVTAPDPALLAFATTVTAITDVQASEISGTFSTLNETGSSVGQALSSVGFGEQFLAGESAGHSAVGGVGVTVSGAIASGMEALSGALSSISMGGQ